MHGEGKKMKESRAKGRGGLEKVSSFTPCLRRFFLNLWGWTKYEGHGVMLASSLRCLQRYLFTYFGY